MSSKKLSDILMLLDKNESIQYIESLKNKCNNRMIELTDAGIVADENGGFYDLFYEHKKMEREYDETLKKQVIQTFDNYKLGWIKVTVGDLVSANNMSNKYYNENLKKYISNNTKEYLSFCKKVDESLSQTNLKKYVNKDNTDILSIDIKVFVSNVRKDTDNCEKAIIDAISRHLGINDNIIKHKKTLCLPRRVKNSDYFMFKLQKITQNELDQYESDALEL